MTRRTRPKPQITTHTANMAPDGPKTAPRHSGILMDAPSTKSKASPQNPQNPYDDIPGPSRWRRLNTANHDKPPGIPKPAQTNSARHKQICTMTTALPAAHPVNRGSCRCA